MHNNDYKQRHWSLRWLMLFGFFLIGLIIASLVSAILLDTFSTLTATAIAQVLQAVFAFILPVVTVACIIAVGSKSSIIADLGFSKGLSLKWVIVVVGMYVISLPCLNYLVVWNEGVHLPAGLTGLETQLRAFEDAAKTATSLLLGSKSWLVMILMVLIVGVLTGIGEEMFFRAGLLKPMTDSKVNIHFAVWYVAIIFSAIHFQFFGFVPRMILGAWLGYLFVWSRSLWVPILAHALNNSMVVVMTYLANIGLADNKVIDSIGVPQSGTFPYLALCSAVLWIVVSLILHKKYNKLTSE